MIMETFIDYCKNYATEHLELRIGQKVYPEDLGFDLTEGPNMDGSLTYSRKAAEEYLREWWEDAADYFDYAKSQFGEVMNPFEDPEGYMVCMVIEGVRIMVDTALDELGYMNIEDGKLELTEEVVGKISEHIKNNDIRRIF